MSSFFRDHGAAAATLALWPPVTMGVASLLYRRRQSAAAATASTATATNPPLRPYKQPTGAKVIVVDSVSQWEKVWTKIEIDLKEAPLIGLDCEWVSAGSPRTHRSAASADSFSSSTSSSSATAADIPPQPGRVALLQISTASGLCVLVRLLKLVVDVEDASASVSASAEDSSPLPESFRSLLKDKNISKLGVGVKEDATRLFKDHGLEVKGCVDLRAVVAKCTGRDLQASADSNGGERLGLKTLCEVVLKQTLVVEKQSSHRIRGSNWEAAALTQEQVQYAANEVLVAIDIFREVALSKMRGKRCYCGFCSGTIKLTPNFWRSAASLCDGFADLDYQIISSAGNSRSERGAGKVPSPKPILDRSLRPMKDPDAVDETLEASKDADAVGEPLGDDIGKSFVDLGAEEEEEVNYKLLTPDGEFFSECAASRALWYVDNGFGELIPSASSSSSSTSSYSSSTTSPSISLNFDPVGEPFEEKGVFYGKGEGIFCVVCGSEDRFCLRKDIVPKMYRDHFPPEKESSQDILLMCSKCHRESIEMDNEFSVDLAKSCNAFPVGSTKDSNNVDPSQAATVVEWMKAAYSGSILQFERLWRQNFLEKMGPKHLPVTWSLERIQKTPITKPSGPQSAKSVNSDQKEQSKTNTVGAEPGAKSRSRKASMRDRGSAIVRFFSYLDPLVVGIPSFFLSRVLDHTNRLGVESPQRSMHDQIADFAHHPVFKQKIEPQVKFEVKEAPITVSSFDAIGGLWTGGVWTAIRALTDRARERNERHELSSEDRHQLESVLGVWTGGISVVTQQLFAMNLLTEKSVQTTPYVGTSEVPAVAKRLVQQYKDSSDLVSLSSSQTFNLDSLLSVWSFGLWSLTKSMISVKPKKEATLGSADQINMREASHSVLKIPQQLDSFLTMWSFGVWTLLRTLTGAEQGVNEDHSKATIVGSSGDQGSADEKSQVLVSSSDDITESLSLVEPNELFLSVWTMGLWHALRTSVISASLSKSVGSSREPAKIEKVSHATESDSKDEGSMQDPTSSKPIFLAKDLQSILSLLNAWSFGLVTLISIVINRGSITVQDLHKLAVTETKKLGLVKQGQADATPVEAFVEIPPERFHNIFISIWTFSLCNLLKLVSKRSPFSPNQEEFIAGPTAQTSTSQETESLTAQTSASHETEPSTAQTSASHETEPSNFTAEAQSLDAVVTIPVEKVSPSPVSISSNFSQGILEEYSKNAIKILDPVNRLLSIWSFGIWELILMIVSREVTSMSSVKAFPKDVEERPKSQIRQFVESTEDTSSPVYISEPSDFFYIFWSLGLWPYYSLIQKRIFSLLPIYSDGKNSLDSTLKPIGEKDITQDEAGKKTYLAKAEFDSKAEFADTEESKLEKQHSDETDEVSQNESQTTGLDIEETVETASNDEPSLQSNEENEVAEDHLADSAANESTTAASTFQTPHWFHDVLSVWSFGAWTVLRLLQKRSCLTMEQIFGEVQTNAQQIEAQTRLQKSSQPPSEASKMNSSKQTPVDCFSAVELFFVVWSMGLWQINSSLYDQMQRIAPIVILQKLSARKKSNKADPLTSTLPLTGSNTQAISVTSELADNKHKETLVTSETKVGAEREDQNIENASEKVSDEEPAVVLHEKSEPDLIKSQIDENQSADVETMQETLDSARTYLDYLKITQRPNEIMSVWSFGVWTILEVLLKQGQLTIEMLQVEAAKYGKEMEMNSEIKTRVDHSISNAFNEEAVSCDYQETYFFLLSFGLINYIETLKKLSANLQLTAVSDFINVLVDKTKQVGSMMSKTKVNKIRQIQPETSEGEPSDKDELTTDTVTDMQPEVMNAIPNLESKDSLASDQTEDEPNELLCLPSNEVELSEVLNKDSETQLPAETLVSKAETSATDEDVDSTPQHTTMESIQGVSLADVWTFGMLSSTKKLLDMGGFLNPTSELLMGIWSLGLLPPRKPTEISSAEKEMVHLAQKSSIQSSQNDDALTVEEADEPGVTVRNDAMLQNLAANVWTFGFNSVIQTVFEHMTENRKMFEFWFNIWLLGLWPTTEVEDSNGLIENKVEDPAPSKFIEKTPKVSPIQQNDSEVISAHDAVLAVMTLGIWVHFKALLKSIKEKSDFGIALEENESKTKALPETDQKTNIQLLENYPQIVLFSTILNYWSFGIWSLVLGVLQKSTTTIKAIEDESIKEAESNVINKSTDKLDEAGNKVVSPKKQDNTLEISNNPTQYLLDLWSCGLFGLLPVLKDQSDKFHQFKDLFFSLWTFGLWNLFQDVQKLESPDASATDETVSKGNKTLSVHSLLSMWTLGLWINTKTLMARTFNSGTSDIINARWLSWLGMLIKKESLLPQKLKDVESKEESGNEQLVTPKLSQDTEKEGQSEHGSNSPNNTKSADYEMLHLEFDDLLKRFSSQLGLPIIHAVYEESHGNASTAYEILESMIESKMSSETFVHSDREGNELSNSIFHKPTHDDNQTKFPVLKIISPPTIKTVTANNPELEESETKYHVTSVAIDDVEETESLDVSLEGKDEEKIGYKIYGAGKEGFDAVISEKLGDGIELEAETSPKLDTSTDDQEFEHIDQTLSSDDMLELNEDLVSKESVQNVSLHGVEEYDFILSTESDSVEIHDQQDKSVENELSKEEVQQVFTTLTSVLETSTSVDSAVDFSTTLSTKEGELFLESNMVSMVSLDDFSREDKADLGIDLVEKSSEITFESGVDSILHMIGDAREISSAQAGTKDGTDYSNTEKVSMISDEHKLEMQVDVGSSLSANAGTLHDHDFGSETLQQLLDPETAHDENTESMQNLQDIMVLSTHSSESSSSQDYEKISLLESLSPTPYETIVFSDAEKTHADTVDVLQYKPILDHGEQTQENLENLTCSETAVSTEIIQLTSVDSGLSDEKVKTFETLSLHGQGNNLQSDDASLDSSDHTLSGESFGKEIITSEKSDLSLPESQDSSFVGWIESLTTIEKRIKSEANFTSQDADVSLAQSHITFGTDSFVAAEATQNVDEVDVSIAVAAPAKGVEVDEVLESDVKTAVEKIDSGDEGDDDESDESDDDSEDDDDNDEEISKILALAKKMESKPKTEDDWLSKLAKKISKPETTEVSETKDNEQNRDVFGDKDWDTCHDLEDSETEPVNPVPCNDSEYDMSSDIETAASDTASNARRTFEYDMSSELETATSYSANNAGGVKGHRRFDEYDLVSSSAVSLSDESSTKESTPVQESEEKDDKFEVMTSTPIIVRRTFTSSKQKLNESHAEVNVTLDHMSSLKKKLSESTTSLDSTDNISTITKESVIPELVITGEEGKSTSAFFSTENLSSRQEITHVTQSRVLYRSKSPSRSRFSESSDSSEEKENLSTSTSGVVAIEGAVGMTKSESAESASVPVLGSHLESTEAKQAVADQSDSESNADQEDVWVTETSEMVTSFVTETVRKMKIDEDGNEVVEEIVRVLGPDGREVSPEIVTLMRSPSFVRKN